MFHPANQGANQSQHDGQFPNIPDFSNLDLPDPEEFTKKLENNECNQM